MSTMNDGTIFMAAVRKELEARIEAEIERAGEELKAKLREQVGQIALKLLAHYELESGREFITLRVRNTAHE
jgi:hypothetical protein